MKSYGKFKGVFTWLFNTVVSMYKQNFTLQSTYERTYKKQTLLLFKVLRITLSSDKVYGEFTVDFLMSLLQMLLHSTCTPLFYWGGGGLNIPPFLRERGGLRKTWSFYVKKFPKTAGISIFYVVIAVLLFVGHLLTSRRIYRFLITGTLPARQTNPNTQ